ncbi:hypothetical protein [Neptuniibacter halophilus]|uniref:hypothetical protein n=1 Tax=Neptuniibacter halophilus TaxID=651666 RepID=UPI0025738A4B|nr:hypothetical protein [Neptuniibacter halophilus]
MMLRHRPLILLPLLLAGCVEVPFIQREAPQPAVAEQSYCYNGGRTYEYSCEQKQQLAPADMRETEVDEEWMYRTLGELKVWIAEQKQSAKENSADE